MKKIVAIAVIGALLASTVPMSAGETAHFISKGKPLTAPETAALGQRAATGGRISRDAGGEAQSSGSIVLVFVAVIACGGVVIYVSTSTTVSN